MTVLLTERALERRLKRHFLKLEHSFFCPCVLGFEDILAEELKEIPDVTTITPERGGVAFKAPLDTMYHANLQLRTAHRVLLRVEDFLAQSYPMLFNKAKKVPWELYLGFAKKYKFSISAKTSKLMHHKNIAKTLEDAMNERLKTLGLSASQSDKADLDIHVRFFEDRCTLSLNTSGEHLHKRGYRTLVSEAPLRETLAAASLLKVNARSFDTLIDPMCGSGTLLIEAAQLENKQAAGLNRSYAFESFPFFHRSKWERFKKESTANHQVINTTLLGFDINRDTLKIAKQNSTQAAVNENISFKQADARFLELETEEDKASQNKTLQDKPSLLIISNLPYGERLGSEKETKDLLLDFRKNLIENFKGCSFALITKDKNWLEHSALTITKVLPFKNGGLSVYLITGTIRAATE